LRTLLNEALGRLTGAKAGNSPVIRLETSFGGGKTHNLIGLYHVASGKVNSKMISDLLPSKLIPEKPIRTISLIGSDLDPGGGMKHGKVTTFTLWGEMVYQRGGLQAYKMMEENDKNRGRP
jgi:predicted AAA+ superfamily ATPase